MLEELKMTLRNNPEDKPKELIYHYTSMNALSEILGSKYFWMTDYKYLNDPSEFRYSSAIINACLDKHMTEPAIANIRQKLQFFLEYDMGPCIVAFSADPDSLYQWRAYGDDGNGICIGIKPPIPYIRNLSRVIYDKTEQSDIVEQWIKRYVDTCNRYPTDSLTSDNRAHHLYMILVELKTRFKYSAYSIEKEWRYANFPADFQMKVREGRKGSVAYFPADSILDDTDLLLLKTSLSGSSCPCIFQDNQRPSN